MPLVAPCTPVPRARRGGWAHAEPCGPGPHIWTLHLPGLCPATAPSARLGPPPGARGTAVPRLARPAPPPARTKAAPPRPSRAAAPFRGLPLPSRLRSGGAGWKQRRRRRRRRGDKGAGGRGRGAHQSAALSSRITSSYAASSSRRWPLKLTPAMLRAGLRPNGQTHRQTAGQRRREGKRESPPPPRSLCSVASSESQRPGEGSRPAGGGGRWLRPARSLRALGPSAAQARPRGRPAPPSRPAPGRPRAPHPQPQSAAPEGESATALAGSVPPMSRPLTDVSPA